MMNSVEKKLERAKKEMATSPQLSHPNLLSKHPASNNGAGALQYEMSAMPEIKRPVQAIEVNYVCDKCEHGMMASTGDMNSTTGEIPHKCMICSHQQVFKWVSYPKITYVGLDEGNG